MKTGTITASEKEEHRLLNMEYLASFVVDYDDEDEE